MVDIAKKAEELAIDETPAPEVGEILSEYRKVFEKMMEGIISKHRDYAPVYFIDVLTQKDPFRVNLVHRKFVVRKTCPLPTWNSEVYSYDNKSDKLCVEWVLPSEQDAMNILKNEAINDQSLVMWIKKMRNGTLTVPAYSPE